MKLKLLWGLLASFALASCTSNVPDKVDTFDYVCYSLGLMYEDMSCDGLEPPQVITTELLHYLHGGKLGVFVEGEPYVWVVPGIAPEQRAEIVMHETAHYVIDHLQLISIDDRCEREKVARLVSNGPWDKLTRQSYSCP